MYFQYTLQPNIKNIYFRAIVNIDTQNQYFLSAHNILKSESMSNTNLY